MKTSILAICLWCCAIGINAQKAKSSTIPQTSITGFSSWYSRESAAREGTGGISVLMANGQPLDDNKLTCAIPLQTAKAWNMRFGDKLLVRNLADGRTVTVTYTDRGPGRKARRRGVVIDLTPAAMRALDGAAGIKAGLVKVRIEKQTGGNDER